MFAVCDKSFTQISSLELHKRIHGKEKLYNCTECSKSFLRADHLRSHSNVHTNEKPFSCSKCDKRFKHKHPLKTHRLVHSGHKPFSCSECDQKLHNWRRHMTRSTIMLDPIVVPTVTKVLLKRWIWRDKKKIIEMRNHLLAHVQQKLQ